ncbi:hypothetical protein C6P46_006362 [Rhodotorula mucilaginosa]|uniref:Lipid droplet-associated hydrolase n=1 Tax=Rhodotorula mucilaginosa TaxID=5537 RepID=A0A9P7B8A4_RHOMI|nr:hypothetical protein C6P46_006362 [Rhodotorula mucilaginosa]
MRKIFIDSSLARKQTKVIETRTGIQSRVSTYTPQAKLLRVKRLLKARTMSSLIPRGPPAPPPPKASTAGTPSTREPGGEGSLAPPAPRRGHKSVKSQHYNDAPDELDLSLKRGGTAGGGSGSQKRTRAPSRVVADAAALQATPATTRMPSVSPPLTRLHRRYGPPRSTGADAQDQWPADVLLLDQPALAEPTKLVILMVPGNPGLVSYYREFLPSIRDALPADLKGQTVIHAIGHLEHTPNATSAERRGFKPNAQPTLEDQVADKVAYLDELAETYRFGEEGAPKLILLGHSIGAWIGLQMLKERPSLVSAVHALFPTFSHMAQTPNGRSLSPLFSSWSLRPVFYSTSFLSYLPTGLTSRLVSLVTGQSGSGANITTELVSSPETVIAALVMARQELAKVTALDVDLLDQYGDRLWIYWTEKDGDGWVTEEAIQEIEACLEKKWGEAGRKRRARCREGMPHAFVLDEGHTTSLARKCADWIVADLAESSSAAATSGS